LLATTALISSSKPLHKQLEWITIPCHEPNQL
jgi:hypothetical protein